MMNVYTKKVDLSLDRDEFNQKYGRKKSLSTFTLGCKVNQYETQALKEKFEKAGYEVVAENAFADVYVINTCTVTSLSDKKSRQYIRRVKRINPDSITAVVGCYAQVSPAEAAGIEGVNIVAGTNEKNNLVSYIERYVSNHINGQGEQGGVQAETHIIPLEELTQYEDTGTITSMDSRVRAYIKVQEGCNRFCSYCMIPYARGAVRSRRASEIVEEAENLLHQGVKEIVLTGINTALYGMEKDEKVTGQVDGEREETGKKGAERELYGIEVIVKLLNELPGDFRIRIGSLEPTVVNKAYAERLLKYEKLCPHFHLSLQSGSDGIIKAMNRHYTGADYLDLVNMLRGKDACFGVTTDIIVG
ncbi:MAG: MiaB/RimO family radical SAM methylthiotransferase, partial [Anaerovorax sp.]